MDGQRLRMESIDEGIVKDDDDNEEEDEEEKEHQEKICDSSMQFLERQYHCVICILKVQNIIKDVNMQASVYK